MFLILRTTYSKYVSEANGDAVAQIGIWEIFVNGEDIAKPSGKQVTFNIDAENVKWNNKDATNVKKGKVAPGMDGTYEIKIDPQNTDTSLKYSLELDATSLKDTNLEITNISLANGKEFDSIENINEELSGKNFSEIKNYGKDKYKLTRTKKLKEEIKRQDGSKAEDDKRIDNIIISIIWNTPKAGDNSNEFDRRDTILASKVYTKDEKNIGELPVTLNVIQYMGE